MHNLPAEHPAKSVLELMPATAPGSLTPEQAAEITAYQLNKSGFPAGTAPLSTKLEELMQIKIDPAK